MSYKDCVLLLGSNINDKYWYLEEAKKRIKKEIGVIQKFSNQIETEPIGFCSKEKVLNQKIRVETKLSPIQLLRKVKFIEKEVGRKVRTPKEGDLYADREIDIDILFYSQINFRNKILVIPHPQVYERDFIEKLRFNDYD